MTKTRQPQLRSTPQQERSRRTLEHILATAAELLAEVGLDGFNTNLLAERADVRVRTIYRYFPDKLAIVHELARRLADAWDDWFDDAALADPRNDLRTVWQHYVDGFVAGVTGQRGGLAIRAVLHSTPELRDIEVENTRRLGLRLARALRARDPKLSAPRARTAAQLILETAIATLDAALTGPPRQQRALLDELVEMQVRYLEGLLS
jgi:AcrR family transcriptional regulator